MWKIFAERKGAVAAMVALALPAMLGFGALAVDVGSLYVNRTQLSAMADAAVLAGAQELPKNPDQATVMAKDYAGRNGLPGDTVAGRKVVKLLADKRVIAPLRRFWPVLVNGDAVIGVAGIDLPDAPVEAAFPL